MGEYTAQKFGEKY